MAQTMSFPIPKPWYTSHFLTSVWYLTDSVLGGRCAECFSEKVLITQSQQSRMLGPGSGLTLVRSQRGCPHPHLRAYTCRSVSLSVVTHHPPTPQAASTFSWCFHFAPVVLSAKMPPNKAMDIHSTCCDDNFKMYINQIIMLQRGYMSLIAQ